MLFLIAFESYEKSDPEDIEINPFGNGGNERNMIVVISDLHLGADLDYAECKDNLPSLENLLKRIKVAPNITGVSSKFNLGIKIVEKFRGPGQFYF
jgi:hypothetical protein